jgi:hypothetical protein
MRVIAPVSTQAKLPQQVADALVDPVIVAGVEIRIAGEGGNVPAARPAGRRSHCHGSNVTA